MLKTAESLWSTALYEGKLSRDYPYRRLGNHRVERDYAYANEVYSFYYYSTIICQVDVTSHTVKFENGGYNTSSTNRAIGTYRNLARSKGYRNMSTNEKYMDPEDLKVLKEKLKAEGEKDQAKKSFYED